MKKRSRKKRVLITGIDVAGRGALIGPMVICGITVEKGVEKKLAKIGVKDSKMLTPKKREELYKKIKEIVQTKSRVSSIIPISIQPCKIDDYRGKKVNLNMIEARTMAQIINISGGDEIYLDALTSRPEKFKKHVVRHLDDKSINIIAENKADKNYTIVAAASIIAKVERDRAIKEIKKQSGVDFGVGYPHDERTIEFVNNLIKSRKKLPTYVRKSWVTTQMLQERNWQRKIKDFIFGNREN
jgi:ribonuclease HII